jgi:iron complex outermembrane recepter protein
MASTGFRTPGSCRAGRRLGGTSSVATAVFFALYGLPPAAFGDAEDSGPNVLQEITVTATRREQTVEAVPYSLSVVSSEQLAAAGVTDLMSLSTTVPGLSTYDYGARFAGATSPIIRGINATGSPARGFRSFEQAPVGTYIGNSPIDGYFQLDDLNRIEILRGPQGTLYGAGALGGAIRLIPNSPQLDKFEGSFEAGGSRVAHSDGTGYSLKGMINVPLGDVVAFRASARYDYDPGWISTFGLLDRTNNTVYGVPLLANPSDIINSSPIYNTRDDWNWQKTFTGRASVLWKPDNAFSAEAAITHSKVTGDGGPQVNPTYAGGVSPIDPNTIYPPGGNYRELALVDEPFDRTTDLASLDLSYDVGFATVSATSSYYTTDGSLIQDSTFDYGGFAGGYYVPYYAGIPTNPRWIFPFLFTDSAHTFTQEVRLVSNSSDQHMFDYVLGAFYENQTNEGNWFVTTPGSPARSIAQGCTGQVFYNAAGLSGFPNCLVVTGPNDLVFQQLDKQNFTDKSLFGELTWHFLRYGQVTGGVRHFQQDFTDAQLYQDFTFNALVPPTPHEAPASKTVGKVDVSYEYSTRQYVYALWSQGFRRGGANSLPPPGNILAESPLLATYKPDSTNNYEAGLKGRLDNGLSYAFSGFLIHWDNPQISSSLPSGNLAVYNANTAESWGFEFESTGPLFIPQLTYSVGFAYVDAYLTSGFSYPANNGLGQIVPGLLSGSAGEQMPGSPKTSVSAALIYDINLSPGYLLTISPNAVYRSPMALQVAPSVGTTTIQHSSSYQIVNLSIALTHGSWRTTLYSTNLLDKQEILAPPSQPNQFENLTNDYLVNPPRTIGLRVAYTFGK